MKGRFGRNELGFTKTVFLPIFFELVDRMGVKPLIVALAQPSAETSDRWTCHPTMRSFLGVCIHLASGDLSRLMPPCTN